MSKDTDPMDGEMSRSEKLALALSGGGVRAMAFHAGVLKYLAESGQLEKVVNISSVSGGSLIAGLVFCESEWQWPTGEQYLTSVLPAVREHMLNTNIQRNLLLAWVSPWNWHHAASRVTLLSKLFAKYWGINVPLDRLPQSPIWSINGTTAETGRRFRFKFNNCGDYSIGYAQAHDFSLADAMAMSAGFPVGIGPLRLRTGDFEWRLAEFWDQEEEHWPIQEPPFKTLHLYDGGVYDNLGTEPLFDSGDQTVKVPGQRILVSDAGRALDQSKSPFSLDPRRIQRLLDITTSQTRALRVRSFIKYLKGQPPNTPPGDGAYIEIGTHAPSLIERFKGIYAVEAQALSKLDWLKQADTRRAANISTSLSQLKPEVFDLLVRHGCETARCVDRLFS